MVENKINKIFTETIPLPICLVDSNGKISDASPRIDEVFLYDGIKGVDVFALTGIKYEELVGAAEKETPLFLSRNQKTFKILTSFMEVDGAKELAVYFMDTTSLEEIATKYK
ncbi:MAG: hypothetical protein RR661_05420, partial [Anaerovoracaceae bacterium]